MFIFQEEEMRQFAFAVGLVFTNGYLQTVRGKNTHVGLLIVFLSDTSEAPLLFVRVDGWDLCKIQIGKKMIFYMQHYVINKARIEREAFFCFIWNSNPCPLNTIDNRLPLM